MSRFLRYTIVLGITQIASPCWAELPVFDCIIEPSDIVNAGSSMRGVLKSVNFDRSDVVERGDVLARLESDVEQATLKRAKFAAQDRTPIQLQQQAYTLLRQNKTRNESLAKMSAISEQTMDQLETETEIAALRVQEEEKNLQLALIEYERAQAVMEKTVIRSPIEGVIVQRYKTEGEYIDDEPLAQIAKLHPLHVEVLVPTEHMGKIKPGMLADVSTSLRMPGELVATVERIDRVADAASDTFGVRLRLDNPDYEIPAGLRCNVAFDIHSVDTDHSQTLAVHQAKLQANRALPETEAGWVFGPLKLALTRLRSLSKPQDKTASGAEPDDSRLPGEIARASIANADTSVSVQ